MRSFLTVLTLCILVASASAQVGNLDPAFGGTGLVKSGVNGTSYKNIVVQTDGKILVGGTTELVRYNTNGTLDASFGTNGKQATSRYPVYSLGIQNDGKIIVGSINSGGFLSTGFILLRYTSGGKLDSTFGINGIRNTDFTDIFNGTLSFDGDLSCASISISLQDDGKIVAAGLMQIDRGNSGYVENYIAFARYTTDGILDRTFASDGKGRAENWSDDYNSNVITSPVLALQADRKLIVAGSRDGDFVVTRYNADGTIDPTFSGDGIQITDFGFDDQANAVAIQADGKIVVSGSSNGNFATVRYLTNGNPDTGFDGDGKKTTDFSSLTNDAVFSATIQSDGKVVIVGTNSSRFALARYNTNGALDITFSGDGKQTTDVGSGIDIINSIAISGNRLLLAGVTSSSTGVQNGVVGAYSLGTLPSTTNPKAIKVNVYGGANLYSNSEWNNWNVGSSLNSGALKFASGAASTISAVLSSTGSVVDNGSAYGGYMAPPLVLRYGSTGSSARTLIISGLTTTKKYSLEIYATRANTGNTTRFTINGSTVAIVTDQNKTIKASFINLVPASNGQIVVNISNVKTYNYINGFILTEQSGTCPGPEATPLYPLKAQFCGNSPITLTASGGTSYQWYNANGSVIAGQTGPTYTTTQAGIYTVRAFNGTCASGLSEYAALEAKLAAPVPPPGPIGNAHSGFYCVPANIGVASVSGQTYTFLRNGTAAAGPVDGSGNPISYGFTRTTTTRVLRVAASSTIAAPSTLRSATNARLTASEYTIQPTYYTIVTTKPGCTDTLSSQTFEIYHATPVEGLAITALDKTSANFTWKPLFPNLTYHYQVWDVGTNSLFDEGYTDYETLGKLTATISSLISGKAYKIEVTGFDQDSPDGCTSDPAILEFTTPILAITTFLPASGAPGVGVMIKGTSLTNVSAVRFNGVTATEVYSASPTLLYAKVPSGATTGKIKVVADNDSTQSATSFTVAAIASSWVSKTALNAARLQHGTIATAGKIFVFGGYNSSGHLNSLEIYNPSTNTWTAGAAMPVATRGMAVALGSDGNIYMFGGATVTNTVASSFRYTVSSNTWTALANVPVAVFEAAAAATSNGKIYLFGGEPVSAKNTSTNATRIYDIATNTWSTGVNMPVGVQQQSAITGNDGKIYVIGGRAFSAQEPLGLVQIYNPGTNTWNTGAPMLIPKVQFGAVKAGDGRIYVVGGKASEPNNKGPFFHTVEVYTPSTNTWASGPVLPKQFGQQTAAKLNDDLYALGGSDGTYRNFNYKLVVTPVAPSSLAASAVSSSQINLTWKDNSLNETSFVLERATTSSGPFSVIATLGANVKTYSNTGLTAAMKYYYRVKATNAAGSSPYSSVVNATTLSSAALLATGASSEAENQELVNSLSVHPNPAPGNTWVRFTVRNEQHVQLGIYDTRGNLVTRLYEGIAEGNKSYQFAWKAETFLPGLYVSRLMTTEGAVLTEKIILLPK